MDTPLSMYGCPEVYPERWAPIPDWESWYDISTLGRCRSLPRTVTCKDGRPFTVQGRILLPRKTGHGYLRYALVRDGKQQDAYAHVLVREVFGLDILPNDISRRHGHGFKLTEAQVREIKALAGQVSQRELAKRFGVSHTAISQIVNRQVWKDVEPCKQT
jgi:hypothetical protein